MRAIETRPSAYDVLIRGSVLAARLLLCSDCTWSVHVWHEGRLDEHPSLLCGPDGPHRWPTVAEAQAAAYAAVIDQREDQR